MTRDEAVARLRAVKDRGDYTFKSTISAHGFVDGLVALGLLKFNEPVKRTVEDRFAEAIHGFGNLRHSDAEALLSWINDAHLRVVPA